MLNQTSNITKSGGDWNPSSKAYSQLPSDVLIPCDEKKRILSSLLNGVNMTRYSLVQRTQLTNAVDLQHWRNLNRTQVLDEDDCCPNCGNPYDDNEHMMMDDEGDCLSCLQIEADLRHDQSKDPD